MVKPEPPMARQPSMSIRKRWRIAHKLTFAFILMVVLTVVAGGVGLWQVLAIGQAVEDTHAKEQQLAWSLELLAAGQRLVGALDRMLLTEDPLLASTELAISLGTLSFYMETLEEFAERLDISDRLGEIHLTYSELREAVNQMDVLARQELWSEARAAQEQEVKPANERMALLTRRLVRQANREARAVSERAQLAVRQASLRLAILAVLALVIALGWRRFVFQELSLSITQLRQGVARISSGDLDYKLRVQTGDEIEELGHEFNKMAHELADLIGNLEQRVADRTVDLEGATTDLAARTTELEQAHERQMEINRQLEETFRQSQRRATLLQASAQVSRATAQIRDLDHLLPQVTQLISQHFGFYHVGVFLIDEAGRYAVLQAANSSGGRKMLTRQHKLAVGSEGIVGHVTRTGQPRIALDVGTDAFFFNNPDLPNTRSEITLPLRIGSEVIGALDVQSTQEAAFDQEDVAVLTALADQIAIAIENARLFKQSQMAFEEVERAQRRYIQRQWFQYTQEQPALAYEYTLSGVHAADDSPLPEAETAWREGKPVVVDSKGVQNKPDEIRTDALVRSALAVPIQVHGETIGILDLQEIDNERIWSDDEIALVKTVADQLGQALEGARLFEQTEASLAETQTLFETSRSLAAAQEVEEIWQAVVDAARRRQADACVLLLFDTQEPRTARDLVLATGWERQHDPPRLPIGARLPLSKSGLFDQLHLDQPLSISDLAQARDMDQPIREFWNKLGFSALLHQPIAIRGHWFGLLTVLYQSPHVFSSAETGFFRTLADQAALAFEGQRLLFETQRQAEREQLIRNITDKVRATPDLETILQTTVQELSKAMGLPRAFVRLGTEEELIAAPPAQPTGADETR